MPVEEITGKVVEKAPSWFERLLMPALDEMKGDIKAIHGELKAVNTRIDSTNERINSLRNETKTELDSLRNEMKSENTRLEERMASLRNEMKSEFTGINYSTDKTTKKDISRNIVCSYPISK